MPRRTLAFALLSSLVLSTGACKSMLEPTAPGLVQQQGADNTTAGDSTVYGWGSDDRAGDDRGGLAGGNGADDPAGDDHGLDAQVVAKLKTQCPAGFHLAGGNICQVDPGTNGTAAP
jgi:hypothetical protein